MVSQLVEVTVDKRAEISAAVLVVNLVVKMVESTVVKLADLNVERKVVALAV